MLIYSRQIRQCEKELSHWIFYAEVLPRDETVISAVKRVTFLYRNHR